MLRPHFGEHGSLAQLHLDCQNIIKPWGIETADSRAFFSLETGGWGNKVLSRKTARSETASSTQLTVRMAEGLWRGVLDELVTYSTVERLLSFEALEDTWAMDLVMRFVFERFAVRNAQIAGRRIFWDVRNYYHQYATDQVLLHLEQSQMRISVMDSDHPPDWRLATYVRCSPLEHAWIVHVRLLPAQWNREVIKLRGRGSRHVLLPDRLSHQLLRIGSLARRLRYAGERKVWPGSRVNAYPLALIPSGTRICLRATAELV